MEPDKTTKHFALDTSFIIAQNFLAGTLIINLGKMGKKEELKIYITDIIYREVLVRFELRLAEEAGKINQLRILKNFDDLAESFQLTELQLAELNLRFKKDFDKWIDYANVKVLPTASIPIGKVMDDYFAGNPPFGQGKKKSEFPDAFSFYALEEFFKMGKLQCYLVTNDSDFDGTKSGHIFPIKSITEKLDLIIRAIEQRKGFLKLIEQAYLASKQGLEMGAKGIFTAYLEEQARAKVRLRGIEIDHLDSFEVTGLRFDYGYRIVNQNEFGALLQSTALVSYKAVFIHRDVVHTPQLKKTEHGYHGIEYSPSRLEAEKAIHFYIKVDFTHNATKAGATVTEMELSSLDVFDDRLHELFYQQ
jgi:hypothetical protein